MNEVKIDLTVTISVILALSAIFASVATAIINACHETTLKKLEYAYLEKEAAQKHQSEVFERYMLAAGACIQNNAIPEMKEFRSRSALAMYSVPDDCIREDMLLLEQYMDFADASGQKKCVELLAQITVALRSYYHRPGSHQDSDC